MSTYVRIYRNHCTHVGRNGVIYSGNRWIVRDVDTGKQPFPRTFKTRAEAVDAVHVNLGYETDIVFSSGGKAQ